MIEMNRLAQNIIIIALFSLLSGCKPDTICDCFKSTGDLIWEDYEISNVTVVELHNNIDLFIHSDSIERVMLYAGSNLIEKIEVTQSDSILTLRNYNSCNCVRDFNSPVEVHLYTKNAHTIKYFGYGNIKNDEPITGSSFYLSITDGYGDIDLNLQTHHVIVDFNSGGSTITLKGNADFLGSYVGAAGRLDAQNLKTRITYLNHMSVVDQYVWAENDLDIRIHSIGNIYYKGNPQINIMSQTGSGKVLPIE